MKWTHNQHKKSGSSIQEFHSFSKIELEKPFHFHSSLPEYEATPLHHLEHLAKTLGVGTIYVKDESKRFGLNAFKGLGGSYAIASYFARKLSFDLNQTDFQELANQVSSLPKVTFSTVTAGNHGKGVAWAAKIFNQDAKIYMPKGTSASRLNAIKESGAKSYLSDLNYDDTVSWVARSAAENNQVLIQDTSWEGYEKIPLYIMQGYTTIIAEIIEQLQPASLEHITHIFLQAGVGSFAAAMAATVHNLTMKKPPKIVVVEPEKANCFYQSALHNSGEPQQVHGNLDTMMAGLACGKPNPAAWSILKSISDYFVSADDTTSAKGMQISGNPMGNDARIISGESGALPLGVLHDMLRKNKNSLLKSELRLDASSNILIINTEGDTDPDNYRKIVNEL